MKHTIFLLMVLCSMLGRAADFSGVQDLLQRRVPFLHGKTTFVEYSKTRTNTDLDAYRMYFHGEKLVVEATSTSAAATAINYYLKNYCHMSFSHADNNFHMLRDLPKIADTLTATTDFQWRYALNYCTYNYTFSFYSWEDWERELDWMALNGVNLMLSPIGTEAVWQQVLTEFGFTDSEIKNFLPGPAFTAWWLMGNLEGWGGAVSDAMILHNKSMQQKILARMRELGITPVMQAFWGMVPDILQEKYPSNQIMPQGTWAGGFKRPALLLPYDPLYEKMAARYYHYMKEFYFSGEKNDAIDENNTFWGGDLFHEGGSTQGIDVTMTARMVQQNMQKHFPNATWLLQGWGGNPKQELLAGLSKQHTMVIDLFGESQQNWKKREEYGGFPWIWCSVNNFGGKVGMGAQLPTIVQEPQRALEYSKKNVPHNSTKINLRGIGIIPEGIDANPIAYDFALQTAWNVNGEENSAENYLQKYILYRYGAWNDSMYKAWRILLGTAYGDYAHKGEGTYESILCARPSLKISNVSTWGPRSIQYNPEPLKYALQLMRHAAPHYEHSQTYQYDITDLARQVVANHARTIYDDIVKSFANKDKQALVRSTAQFVELILRQDSLLATNQHFRLDRWLRQSQEYCAAVSNSDAALCEKNARTQISYWGPDNPATDLHDYAHKEWSGMLRTLYLRRWQAFFADLFNQLYGNPRSTINYFEMEQQWAKQHSNYFSEPSGNYLKEVDAAMQIAK